MSSSIAGISSPLERAHDGVTHSVPAFRVADVEIWGATAMVLAEFLALLGWRHDLQES